ncbi:hypothetical protein EIP86_009508 [Pleurotus ostreatoroseus]|nr:hypothetical protein EIP86_009508 [Pleurotus ostreatoroseus]
MFDDRIFTTEPEYVKVGQFHALVIIDFLISSLKYVPKIMLATDFTRYEKGALLREQQETFLGDGVFNADGDIWRMAEKALNQAADRFSEGHAIDWQELSLRYTLDVTTEFLLGKNVDSLDMSLSYPPSSGKPLEAATSSHPAHAFGEAFMHLQRITILRSFSGRLWKLREFWKDEVVDYMRDINAFIVPLTEEKLARKTNAQKEGIFEQKIEEDVDEGETLLDHLVNVSDGANITTTDPKIIKDEALNILIAGRDTTASAITFSVYMLAEHPEIFQRLRAEVHEHVGMRRPDYDDIKNMKYLRAVINGTFKFQVLFSTLNPARFDDLSRNATLVPADSAEHTVRTDLFCFFHELNHWSSQTTEDVVLPALVPGEQPLFISAKSRVQYSIMVMHRRKDLWGPDALEFDPDRFLDERLHKYLTPNPFIFLPFNAGPRICLGQQHAYNAISFMLVRLAQHFSSIRLAQKEANPAAVPIAEWAKCTGSNGKEAVRLRSYLTLFVEVRVPKADIPTPMLIHALQGGLWIKMEQASSD